jgi:AraC-like DNA-binding protein
MGQVSLHNLLVLPYIRQADFAARLPWSYGERRLLDYLLVYIEKGVCRFIINQTPYDLNEGDFCLVQPGDFIYLEGLTETVTPFAHLDFFYNPEREHSFPTSAGMINLDSYLRLMQPRLNDIPGVNIPSRFRPTKSALFESKFLRMIGRWREGKIMGIVEVQQLGTELFLELMRDFGNIREGPDASASNLDRVLALLSLHLHEPLSVKEMANLVHLSPSRFTAVFKEKYGVSPYQYLLQLRIERASEMLQANSHSVTQISEYCGFNNIQHFSYVFKDVMGKTPSSYRKSFAK